jgi:hypothetical protein
MAPAHMVRFGPEVSLDYTGNSVLCEAERIFVLMIDL